MRFLPEVGPRAPSDTLAEYPGLPLLLQRETNVPLSSPCPLSQSHSPDAVVATIPLVFLGEGQGGVRMREGRKRRDAPAREFNLRPPTPRKDGQMARVGVLLACHWVMS